MEFQMREIYELDAEITQIVTKLLNISNNLKECRCSLTRSKNLFEKGDHTDTNIEKIKE